MHILIRVTVIISFNGKPRNLACLVGASGRKYNFLYSIYSEGHCGFHFCITIRPDGPVGSQGYTKYLPPSTSLIGVCPLATVVGVRIHFFKNSLTHELVVVEIMSTLSALITDMWYQYSWNCIVSKLVRSLFAKSSILSYNVQNWSWVEVA